MNAPQILRAAVTKEQTSSCSKREQACISTPLADDGNKGLICSGGFVATLFCSLFHFSCKLMTEVVVYKLSKAECMEHFSEGVYKKSIIFIS